MRIVLFAATALALAACASQAQDMAGAQPEGRDCFRTEDVDGFSMIDDHTVRVRVSPNRSYALQVQGSARGLDYSQALAIRSRPSGWVCEGSGAGVDIFGGEPLSRRWPVMSVARIPDAPTGS